MSIVPATGSAAVPVVDQALEPAWVRRGSAATQQDYATALSFERVLVEQLTKSLAATSGLGGQSAEVGESAQGAEPSDAGSSQLSSLLPGALSSGVMNAGGLGLAAQMTRAMEGVHPTGHVGVSGGSAA